MSKSRDIVLKILNGLDFVTKDFENNKKIIEDNIKNCKNEDDIRLIKEITYGVVKNITIIDQIISDYSKIKLNKLHRIVLNALRMGIYQIIYLDRVPEYSILNDSVELVKKYTHKGNANYVNAILRNISRDKEKIIKRYNDLDFDINTLSLVYSFPQFLVEMWVNDYGIDFTRSLLDSLNSKAKLNIRVNITKVSRDDLIKRLETYGYIVEKTRYSNYGLIVKNPEKLFQTEEFIDGYFTVQDESSMLVAEVADIEGNSFVLDVCSAPGGKATHIAEYIGDNGIVLARDKSNSKIQLIKENVKRLGLKSVKSEIFDATTLDNSLIDKVDCCLVDAPCSGLGLIRRKPDIKWNRTLDDIDELILIQEKILNTCSSYVKVGGKLIYSTCTINNAENISQIEKFLKHHKNFALEPFCDRFDKTFETAKKGYVQLFPNVHGTDGFFIASLKRLF
ncbi:MAG: 16S rRNA (cytosine(967)-C(5))-methyltransferase RsmB [Tissierellales bacterium]|nr:16S rRNA (cytosine(967)-C(5))-methyltransferase RsmB [Tissierellales bacterium]